MRLKGFLKSDGLAFWKHVGSFCDSEKRELRKCVGSTVEPSIESLAAVCAGIRAQTPAVGLYGRALMLAF